MAMVCNRRPSDSHGRDPLATSRPRTFPPARQVASSTRSLAPVAHFTRFSPTGNGIRDAMAEHRAGTIGTRCTTLCHPSSQTADAVRGIHPTRDVRPTPARMTEIAARNARTAAVVLDPAMRARECAGAPRGEQLAHGFKKMSLLGLRWVSDRVQRWRT